MKKFVKALDNISEWTGRICSWTVIILALVVAYEVVMRYVFNRPSLCGFEYSKYIYGFHFMMLAAFTLLHDGHVSVDIFYYRFSKKGQTVLDIISYCIFFFPLCFVLLWYGSKFAWDSWMFRETSWSICASPLYPAKMVVPVSIFLLLLQGVSVFIKKWYLLITGDEI